MAVDLLRYARGAQEGLYSAYFLDDQAPTVNEELKATRAAGVQPELAPRPDAFLSAVEDRLHETSEAPAINKPEMQTVLVIDVNLQNCQDVRDVLGSDFDLPGLERRSGEELHTSEGRRAGIVLIDVVFRSEDRFRSLPIIVFSAYGRSEIDARLRVLESREGFAPLQYVDKIAAGRRKGKTQGRAEFTDLMREFVYDDRLYFMDTLAKRWDLGELETCHALGVESGKVSDIATLFDRGLPPVNRDADHRVRALRKIQRRLYNLVGEDHEFEWLTSRFTELRGDRPLDWIVGGRPERLYAVEAFVDFVCGR